MRQRWRNTLSDGVFDPGVEKRKPRNGDHVHSRVQPWYLQQPRQKLLDRVSMYTRDRDILPAVYFATAGRRLQLSRVGNSQRGRG